MKLVKESLSVAEQYQIETLVDQIDALSEIIPLDKLRGLVGTTILLLKKHPVEKVKEEMIGLVEILNQYKK